MISYIVWTLMFYLLFRFIFNFIIPLFGATRQFRSQVKDFQDNMQRQRSGYQAAQQSPKTSEATQPAPKKGDYIEFEEIK